MYGYFYATQALAEHKLYKLPITAIEIDAILKDLGWKVKAFDLRNKNNVEILKKLGLLNYAYEYKAFTYYLAPNQVNAVFYNISLSAEQKAAALSHELGHIKCCHFSNTGILGLHTNKIYDDVQEIEANEFSRNFLAHPLILKKMNLSSINDVCRITLIDKTSAKIQLFDSFNTSNFLTTEEKRLIYNMENFIDEYKIRNVIT